MTLNSLPLELVIEIASNDADLWFKLTLIDERFKEYAYTRPGINTFVAIAKSIYITRGCSYMKIFGKLHSINDEPAFVSNNGVQKWYYNGSLHRADDKPAVIYPESNHTWYYRGEYDDITFFKNTREWWRHGIMYRDNCQPTVIHANGYLEWWSNGVKYMISQIVIKK